MTLFLSTILSGRAGLPAASAIVSALRHDWPLLPAASSITEGGGTISFQLGEVDVVIGEVAAPYPWHELEGPCATSILWPKAASELRGHAAHTFVTVNAGLDPVAKSTVLTQVTVAVMAASPDALGVLWSNAMLLVPKALFVDFARDVLPHGPPLDIWVDFRIRKLGDTSCAGFTTGLAALGLMELEVPDSPEKPWELRQRLQSVAGYLLEHGAVINDGDSVGENADERIRVRFGKSEVGIPGTVMRLTYGEGLGAAWRRLFSPR